MSGKNITFDDEKINKSNVYRNKKEFIIDDIDVNKILISKKEPHGKKSSLKYFIGYSDNDVIRPLSIKLPQMIGYVKHLIVTRQFLSRLLIKGYQKGISRYGKELTI